MHGMHEMAEYRDLLTPSPIVSKSNDRYRVRAHCRANKKEADAQVSELLKAQ